MIFELVKDFTAVLDAMPKDHPRRRILKLLDEAIRRDVHFIDRHPTTLFQCMWNSCWWYDCPEAAKHYVEPERGWDEPPSWEGEAPKLHRLLEAWRGVKERSAPGLAWLRALRPPGVHLGSAQKIVFRGHEGRVNSVCWSPDGARIVSGSDDKTVRVWDAITGAQLAVLRPGTFVSSVCYSPDGMRIAFGGGWKDHTLRVWDAESGTELATFRGHEEPVLSVAYSPDGRRIVSGSADNTVRVWDAQTGEELRRMEGHGWWVRSVAYTPDGARIVSGSSNTGFGTNELDQTLRVWGASSGAELTRIGACNNPIDSLDLSPDGTRIVTSGHKVRLWDAFTGEELAVVCEAARWDPGFDSVAFSPDGTRIVTGRMDRTVSVWDASSGENLAVLRGHQGEVTNTCYSPDGGRIVSGSSDNTVRVWDTSGSVELPLRGNQSGDVNLVSYSPDGARVVSGYADTTLRVWAADTGVELLVLHGHRSLVSSVAFSPDRTRIATSAYDHTVRIWDATTGVELVALSGPKEWIGRVKFSPDGKRVTCGSGSKGAWTWDAGSGKRLETSNESDIPIDESGADHTPWRAINDVTETVVEEAASGVPVAWFSETLNAASQTRDAQGRLVARTVAAAPGMAVAIPAENPTWAFRAGCHLCLITLENALNAPPPLGKCDERGTALSLRPKASSVDVRERGLQLIEQGYAQKAVDVLLPLVYRPDRIPMIEGVTVKDVLALTTALIAGGEYERALGVAMDCDEGTQQAASLIRDVFAEWEKKLTWFERFSWKLFGRRPSGKRADISMLLRKC